jgi:hypothetical protein
MIIENGVRIANGAVLGEGNAYWSIYQLYSFEIPLADGNLTIIDINTPSANTIPLADGNLTIIDVNAPAAFAFVLIGG